MRQGLYAGCWDSVVPSEHGAGIIHVYIKYGDQTVMIAISIHLMLAFENVHVPCQT